jgi:outer membrane protein assembly factor BamB
MRTTRTLLLLLAAIVAGAGCSVDWPGYRYNLFRSANQTVDSRLAHPDQLGNLHVTHTFSPPGNGMFRSSPVVWRGKVYIGNSDGHLYVLDAVTLALLWQFPPANQQALVSQFTCNPSSLGLAASAIIAQVNGTDAVIFGAPDQSIGAHLGSGRLFALNAANGAVIWKSPEIARLTGTTSGSTAQFHEQLGYSSPLVYNDHVYVGIANHCDNPIQNGRIVAVKLADGTIDGAFTFNATNTRGGGIWNSPTAGGLNLGQNPGPVLFTTGNSRCWNGGCQPEPSVDNALAMISVNKDTGAINWKFQPVPFSMDDDPDWAAGVAVGGNCNGASLALSVMKDGWAYGVDVQPAGGGNPNVRWQFPPTGFPFTPGDGTTHNDTRYIRPGAVWSNVFAVTTGGYRVTQNATDGYPRIHGLNVCGPDSQRVRWIIDPPNTFSTLGPITVSGGVFYVGTDQGHLVVFGDPSVFPAAGTRCANTAFTAAQCANAGFPLVANPGVIKNVALGSGQILTEPALASGRVYVASTAGTVYVLEP